jgi:hypothetical protein
LAQGSSLSCGSRSSREPDISSGTEEASSMLRFRTHKKIKYLAREPGEA